MNDGLIPGRYAKALYKQANEEGVAETLYAEMKQLAASYATEPALKQLTDNPFVSVEDKKRVVLSAAGSKAGGLLEKFVLLVVKNRRVEQLRLMAMSYVDCYRELNDIVPVEVVTASELDKSHLDSIVALVQRSLPGKAIELSTRIDASLIGGFVVNVDSLVLDASVKNELNKLRLKLLS